MRKALAVTVEKQPSLPQREKCMERQRIERLAWMYWYDPIDLVRTILSATSLREKMFFPAGGCEIIGWDSRTRPAIRNCRGAHYLRSVAHYLSTCLSRVYTSPRSGRGFLAGSLISVILLFVQIRIQRWTRHQIAVQKSTDLSYSQNEFAPASQGNDELGSDHNELGMKTRLP